MGTSPTEFARQIEVPPNRISQILAGKRSVTGDTALRIGHWFGIDPQFWLNLQTQYDPCGRRSANRSIGAYLADGVRRRSLGCGLHVLTTAAAGQSKYRSEQASNVQA